MALSLKESSAVADMAALLYHFLPGSGSSQWRNHVSFQRVSEQVGVGDFWQGGSKTPAIAALLTHTLERRRHVFERLIVTVVKAGMVYRRKRGEPVRRSEIETLNQLLVGVGFKFPDLWDETFLRSLAPDLPPKTEEAARQDASAQQAKAKQRGEFSRQRESLKDRLYALSALNDRQAAGRALEPLLYDLFKLYGLAPRKPFRLVGEQIDGSFELDGAVYLLEAKWEAQALSQAPLLTFRGKIEGKSEFTRGVMIALNHVTGEALDAITRGKRPNFVLLNGYDLSMMLEGQMRLDTLLRKKVRLLAEEGRVFVSVTELLSEAEHVGS